MLYCSRNMYLNVKDNKPISDFFTDVFDEFVHWFMGSASLEGANKLINFNSLISESKGPSPALSSDTFFFTNYLLMAFCNLFCSIKPQENWEQPTGHSSQMYLEFLSVEIRKPWDYAGTCRRKCDFREKLCHRKETLPGPKARIPVRRSCWQQH